MTKAQFNVRVRPDTIEKAARLAKERGVSQGTIVDDAIAQIDDMLQFRRDRACTKLGLTKDKERFTAWCVENEVPLFGTLVEWESYLEAFDTDGDSADLHATQADAQGVPQ